MGVWGVDVTSRGGSTSGPPLTHTPSAFPACGCGCPPPPPLTHTTYFPFILLCGCLPPPPPMSLPRDHFFPRGPHPGSRGRAHASAIRVSLPAAPSHLLSAMQRQQCHLQCRVRYARAGGGGWAAGEQGGGGVMPYGITFGDIHCAAQVAPPLLSC